MLNCLLNNTAAITIAALICELPETKRPQNTLPVSPAVAGKIAYQTHFHSSRSVAPLGLSVPSVRELEPSAVSARGECDSSSRITPTICNRHIQSISTSGTADKETPKNTVDHLLAGYHIKDNKIFQNTIRRALPSLSSIKARGLAT